MKKPDPLNLNPNPLKTADRLFEEITELPDCEVLDVTSEQDSMKLLVAMPDGQIYKHTLNEDYIILSRRQLTPEEIADMAQEYKLT